VWITDCDGRILLSAGGILRSLCPEGHRADSLLEVFAGNPAALVHVLRALGGETRRDVVALGEAVLDMQWTPLTGNGGEVTGLVVIGVDAAEQLQREARARREQAVAEQLAQLQSDYIAASSHHLRTPLTAIVEHYDGRFELIYFAEFKKTYPMPDEAVESIEIEDAPLNNQPAPAMEGLKLPGTAV